MTVHQPIYGLATPADLLARTGLETLQAVIAGDLPQAPISEPLSFWLAQARYGEVVFEGDPTQALLNPMGIVHGGWALTLIDSACACAGLSVLPQGIGYTTVETKANFTRPITQTTGRVRCIGKVIVEGRQIITAEAKILDDKDKILAHGASTLMVLLARG